MRHPWEPVAVIGAKGPRHAPEQRVVAGPLLRPYPDYLRTAGRGDPAYRVRPTARALVTTEPDQDWQETEHALAPPRQQAHLPSGNAAAKVPVRQAGPR